MQADGGLVEDIGDAAQVGAELRGEPDALRLASRQGRRGAVEREVRQPHFAQEGEARAKFHKDVARYLRLSSLQAEINEELFDIRDG